MSRKFLILDEATSSVDTETEFKVRAALARMVEGRTLLIIAHRLSTIQRAYGKIIVMHKGQLREMGTHQELSRPTAASNTSFTLLQHKDQEIEPVVAGALSRKRRRIHRQRRRLILWRGFSHCSRVARRENIAS